jgi:hypothetical protein
LWRDFEYARSTISPFVRTFSASEGVPLADVLNKRVWVTGKVYGISPEQAWLDHIFGRRPLLWRGGLVG